MAARLGHRATVDRLQAVDQLRLCTREQLEELARLAERIQVEEGEVLAREGRVGREFFLILSGSVSVTRGGRLVNTLGPGNFFGELAALNSGPRNATVTALSDVDLLIIGPREFAATANISGFRDALFKSMAYRLQEADADLDAAIDQQEKLAADADADADRRSSGSARPPAGDTAPGERAPSRSLNAESQRRTS